ncbi:MAG TPA: DUF2249 domain-containing protein [Devosiaceae bacterium]
MSQDLVELDVRPVLRSGGEPFGVIMQTVSELKPGQGIRLLATFEPVPLVAVLARRGFEHEAREIGNGDWEVIFRPDAATRVRLSTATSPNSEPTSWPDPSVELDDRGLEPPEPMVNILAALQSMQPGEVLAARLLREPIFLFPELKDRGHHWAGRFTGDGSIYEIRILVGGGANG